MKLTKSKLKQIIKEEMAKLQESSWRDLISIPTPAEREIQSEAEADGRRDYNKEDGRDDRRDHWDDYKDGKYLEDYQLGWDNAQEAAEYETY